MKEAENNKRGQLVRNSLIFQLKLIADGIRDFALVPISLVATLIGLIRGGAEPEKEFESVIDLGRQTERWINLFGQHEPIEQAGSAGSIDMLLIRVEEVVREQAREGGISDSASKAVTRAITAAQDKARQSGGSDGKPGDRPTEI